MKNIDKRKLIITLCTIVAIVAVGLGIFKMLQLVKEVEQVKDYNTESLRWAIIGAIGSWTGSVFGAIALVVSLVALWLPQRVKIAVGVSTGFILSQIPGIEKIDAYIITVKNTGMKPVTVTNVYLHFGSKKQGDIFVGMLIESPYFKCIRLSFLKDWIRENLLILSFKGEIRQGIDSL